MEHSAEHKLPGGKLVSVKLECDSKIERIEITGDFFLHPEETLFRIEDSLVGTSVDAGESEIAKKIEEIIKDSKAEILGMTPLVIAQTIREALESKCGE